MSGKHNKQEWAAQPPVRTPQELWMDAAEMWAQKRCPNISKYCYGQVAPEWGEGVTAREWYPEIVERILAMSGRELEYVHDYIQWAFPLQEQSMFNRQAPVLTDEDVQVFQEFLPVEVHRAYAKMMLFYLEDGQWIQTFDHNHMRITRILKFLVLVGQKELAEAFYGLLCRIDKWYPNRFRESMMFWTAAVRDGKCNICGTTDLKYGHAMDCKYSTFSKGVKFTWPKEGEL